MIRNSVWAMRGKVVHGHGRGGSQLGFPTANIGLDPSTIDRLKAMENGVFLGWAQVEGKDPVYPMVMSVGYNPHFKDQSLTVEVHFIHKFETDFYDSTVRLVSCDQLRMMSAFTTLEALIEMIKNDIREAQHRLKNEFSGWSHAAFFSQPMGGDAPMPLLQLPLDTPQQVAKF